MGSSVLTSGSGATWNWSTASPATVVTAELLGGGGGGGGATHNTETAAGGGRGGGYVRITITKGAETSLTYTVGAAGSAGTTGDGGNGGYSQIAPTGGSVVGLAPGGEGGKGGGDNTYYVGGTGVNGTAVYTGGTYNQGGNGGSGNVTTHYSGAGGGAAGPTSAGSAASGNTLGGAGSGAWADGNTYQHGGAAGVGTGESNGLGGATYNYGGGASGGISRDSTNHGGGAGGAGIIVLTWTDPSIAIPVATLTVTAKAPTVAIGGFEVSIPAGATALSGTTATAAHIRIKFRGTVPTVEVSAGASVDYPIEIPTYGWIWEKTYVALTRNDLRVPAVASVELTGEAATASQAHLRSVPVVATPVAISGCAPVALLNAVRPVPVATAAVTGTAPIRIVDARRAPAVAEPLAVTGDAPTVTQDHLRPVPAASLLTDSAVVVASLGAESVENYAIQFGHATVIGTTVPPVRVLNHRRQIGVRGKHVRMAA